VSYDAAGVKNIEERYMPTSDYQYWDNVKSTALEQEITNFESPWVVPLPNVLEFKSHKASSVELKEKV
jgi:hypothetical protein